MLQSAQRAGLFECDAINEKFHLLRSSLACSGVPVHSVRGFGDADVRFDGRQNRLLLVTRADLRIGLQFRVANAAGIHDSL